jgi:hypothetical protein
MIYEVFINKQFSRFLEKYDYFVDKLFHKLKLFKNDIVNAYVFSSKDPPKRKNYKYTDKLFLGCILYIVLNNCSWTSFIGPIDG